MSNLQLYTISTVLILGLIGLFLTVSSIPLDGKNECDIKNEIPSFHSNSFELPFALVKPDSTYLVPKKLSEISGITFLNDNKVLSINDEKGILYTFDFNVGEITNEFDFGAKGDYEAITRNDNLVYIAESNGNIKVVDLSKKAKIEEFNTVLSSKNNVEGMCYESSNNQLLLACKGKLENKKKSKREKGIYTFDLTNNKLDNLPYKIIDLENDIKGLKSYNMPDGFTTDKDLNKRIGYFAPSGIDIDPITGHTYILSSRGRILTVLNDKKETSGIFFLPSQLFRQPEGLTFDNKGNLYISNEAKSAKANILKFNRKNI